MSRPHAAFRRLLAVLAVGLAAGAAGAADAATVSFSGSGTAGSVAVAAEASFTISGTDLTVTLRNIAPSNNGTDSPTSTLTGVFFSLPGSVALTPWSASVAAGSILNAGGCLPGMCNAGTTDVGGEFGYQDAPFAGGATRGIASAGYLSTGLSGNIGNFSNNGTSGGLAGVNRANPASLDGINFGIVSAAPGFNPNGGLGVPLLRDSVMFLFHVVPGFNLADIGNVSFQYGTNSGEPNIPAQVPLPGALLLMLGGLAGLGAFSRRRPLA